MGKYNHLMLISQLVNSVQWQYNLSSTDFGACKIFYHLCQYKICILTSNIKYLSRKPHFCVIVISCQYFVPGLKLWHFACWSCCCCCLSWTSVSRLDKFGKTKSSLDLGCLLTNRFAGKIPVVLWGIILQSNKNLWIRVFNEPSFSLFNADLKVCTALSAKPLLAEWYGAVMCNTIVWKYSFISALVKAAALSVTIVSGNS